MTTDVKPRELPQVSPARPPPFALPGEHFAAALAWLLVAAVLMPGLAPVIARVELFDPRVFALVHALVLGVLTSAIFGALQQFVPGGLEVPLRSVRVGHAGFVALESGVLALVVGFWTWTPWLQIAGWGLVFTAVGCVGYNVLHARRKSVHGKQVGLFISVAHSALGLAMAIALARLGETAGWWHLPRLGLLAAHLLLGAVGFGTLTAVGVGSRMLPAFLLAQGDDRAWLRAILGTVSGGLLAFTGGVLFGVRLAAVAGGWLIAIGLALALTLVARWFRRRARKKLDPSLRHVLSAFTGLALATALGLGLLLGDPYRLSRWAALAAALVVGWLVMLVIGVMAKIVSHLSYIHLFRAMPGFARVGNPNLLLQPGWMMVSWALLTAGAIGLPLAFDARHPDAARVAAWAWSAGVAITVANYIRLVIIGRSGRAVGAAD